MEVEFVEELRDRLTPEKTGLQIAANFVSTEELLRSYLNRPYGNAYDFGQIEGWWHFLNTQHLKSAALAGQPISIFSLTSPTFLVTYVNFVTCPAFLHTLCVTPEFW
jgi:hypothetical protein